jgi:hypothetical protein
LELSQRLIQLRGAIGSGGVVPQVQITTIRPRGNRNKFGHTNPKKRCFAPWLLDVVGSVYFNHVAMNESTNSLLIYDIHAAARALFARRLPNNNSAL